jgi:hypothetical protein
MRRSREVTVGSYAQGFLLDAPPSSGKRYVAAGLQGAKAPLKHLIHNDRFTTSSPDTLYLPDAGRCTGQVVPAPARDGWRHTGRQSTKISIRELSFLHRPGYYDQP